ncbi:sigma factor-like helix-turn-helix DNA-binding protein [Brevibacillus daliensis]|uniref:sigma factor-like helix-turn-helix DNA-binding protein n=1 Tax=Brevibacillus daliensis TaxID=2892995 RepID=UPI001E575117|nr:sigma factor-like helix-turn-helix DNA-binding protein [Brevibacillus daliensis]
MDISKGHRNLSVKYTLNDRDGVDAILRDLHRLRSMRFERGDYAACDILIDLDTAIERAGLTVREREALYYVYERELDTIEAGRAMRISRQRVGQLVYTGLDQIATVYETWNYGEEAV